MVELGKTIIKKKIKGNYEMNLDVAGGGSVPWNIRLLKKLSICFAGAKSEQNEERIDYG